MEVYFMSIKLKLNKIIFLIIIIFGLNSLTLDNSSSLKNNCFKLQDIFADNFSTSYLLDNFQNNITDIVRAYSLRKLYGRYSGMCINVRRDSDNTTKDIGFNEDSSLDVGSLLSFVGNNNGFITTWYDQSLNNTNATQTNQSLQPQIVSYGVLLTKNGRATINFNIISGCCLNLVSQPQTISWENIAAVFDSNCGSTFSDREGILGAYDNPVSGSGPAGMYADSGNRAVSIICGNNFYINNINTNYFRNSNPSSTLSGLKSFVTSNSPASPSTGGYRIGIGDTSSNNWKGNISEIILFNNTILNSTDTNNRNIIANDQMQYYNTQMMLDKIDPVDSSGNNTIPLLGVYGLRKLCNDYNGHCITVNDGSSNYMI